MRSRRRYGVGGSIDREDIVPRFHKSIQRDGYYYDHQYHDFVMMSIPEDGERVSSVASRWIGGLYG
jgi:hypothetical protein